MLVHPLHPSVEWGQADPFWDVYFRTHHLDYLELDADKYQSISVCLYGETGACELNRGYEPDSQPGQYEAALYDEFLDMIVAELVSTIEPKTTGKFATEYAIYLPFLRTAKEDEANRNERLAALYDRLEE